MTLHSKTLKILTLNMHKGFSAFNRQFVLHDLKEAIRSTKADIVFLQEVTGENEKHKKKYSDWPQTSHYEFLADEIWPDYAYGKNAVYPQGHHGNAILSKFPIMSSEKIDISTNSLEGRGFLYSMIEIPHYDKRLHCICVHLGLLAASRQKQMKMIQEYIEEKISPDEPILFAGDFNDWSQKAAKHFTEGFHFQEAFFQETGEHAKTFPSWMPLLKLDRIYYRHLKISDCRIDKELIGSKLTDHKGLIATIELS